MADRPCLIHLQTCFQCHTTEIFGNIQDGNGSLIINDLCIVIVTHADIERTCFKMALAIFQKWITCFSRFFFPKKINILCEFGSSNFVKFLQACGKNNELVRNYQ